MYSKITRYSSTCFNVLTKVLVGTTGNNIFSKRMAGVFLQADKKHLMKWNQLDIRITLH
jgi:hypothetical protein